MSFSKNQLPTDHQTRLERAELSLQGLSVGDAFGERFFVHPSVVEALVTERVTPGQRWKYTDDTEMALALYDVLQVHGAMDQDLFARALSTRYMRDVHRGYGPAAHGLLQSIAEGVPWETAAGSLFDGRGSLGNGAAMRVAPLGAYFADDWSTVVSQAKLQSVVTHKHPEGIAGAIAVAIAAAYAWRTANDPSSVAHQTLMECVLEHTPESETYQGIYRANQLPRDATVRLAASVLGTGNRVTAMDTVPFTLWCAQRWLRQYEEAMWQTVSGLGDRDTTCAIVGGIVVLASGRESLPMEWLARREPLFSDPEITGIKSVMATE